MKTIIIAALVSLLGQCQPLHSKAPGYNDVDPATTSDTAPASNSPQSRLLGGSIVLRGQRNGAGHVA